MQANIEKCPSFKDCVAPLCPLDESLPDAVWYPGEGVCVSYKFTSLHWLRIQKRIKKLILRDTAGYFTCKMLDSIKAVSKSIKGIDPDGYASIGVWLSRRSATAPATMPVFAQKPADCSFEKRNGGAKRARTP